MIRVELITPERVVFHDDVDFLAAPTALGEIGVLPGHAPLLAKLEGGDLRLRKDGETRHVAVTGGFVEIQKGSRISIFAETAEFAEEIDVERARLAEQETKSKLKGAAKDLTAEEIAQLRASLLRAQVQLKVARRRSGQNPPAHL